YPFEVGFSNFTCRDVVTNPATGQVAGQTYAPRADHTYTGAPYVVQSSGGTSGTGVATVSMQWCPVGSVFNSGTVWTLISGSICTCTAVSAKTVVSNGATPGNESQTSTVTCRKPDGTTGTDTEVLTAEASKIEVPSCVQKFGTGSYPLSATMTGGSPGAEAPIIHTPTMNPASQYPSCFDPTTGVYLGTCRVKIWVGGVPCVNGMTGCHNASQWHQDHPDTTLECRYGSYVVAYSDCAPLEHRYKANNGVHSVTKVDPGTGLDPNPGATDPDPGDPTPGPTPQCYDGCTTPNIPNPLTPPTPTSSSCLSAAFSFNPVDWVYVPVKCVLSWAFDPDPNVYNWSGFITTLQSRPPTSIMFGLVATIQGAFSGFNTAGDCGTLADFSSHSLSHAQITCARIKSTPGFGAFYGLVQVGLVTVTAIGIFQMVKTSVGGKA
ncbi:MAG: hypothetical protein JWP74_3664, partial [Marmoricola sp.]|nr:hypothetical protein [Marmoricola sp.]